MDDLDKIAIGERLKEFGQKNFKNMKLFAEEFGYGPGSFQSAYLKGRSLPGPKMISKLIKLGCNIDWLLHGDAAANFNVAEKSPAYTAQNKIDQLEKENKELKNKLAEIEKLLHNK